MKNPSTLGQKENKEKKIGRGGSWIGGRPCNGNNETNTLIILIKRKNNH
jgi:hypothetical protein